MNKRSIPNIVFIAPATSQPRYHRRAAQIAKFCNITVFSFQRQYYEENAFPEQIPCHSLGQMSDGRYFRRLFQMIPAMFKIRQHLRKDGNSIFYAMSLDCMVLARLCGLRRGFYEIGDLRQVEGFGKVYGFLEKVLCKNVLGLVLTSPHFYDEFYRHKKVLPRERIYIIENKVNQVLADQRPVEKRVSKDQIVIGLIGLLRYHRPIELLLEFVSSRPATHRVACFGDGPLREFIETYNCENISYHGSFKNPDDLSRIYEAVDLNYVVYDSSSKNVRLAMPNKLFESAYFGVPILCCEGTAVGRKASEWQIGKTVRIESKEYFDADVSSVNRAWLARCSQNCFKIASEELLDDGEKVLQSMLMTAVPDFVCGTNIRDRFTDDG